MDDEPMWAADHVVALTPGSAIIIPETANEFAIKGNHLTLRYRKMKRPPADVFPIITGEAKNVRHELNEGLSENMDELRTISLADFFPQLFRRLSEKSDLFPT
ncbi:hypothetical protein Tco_0907579 [Tanacetum coccineum]|uniref:Reverse transcriptase domain-containing protein n=1 Tax=Tanacetum coccineum TaxID=301880 RepID=A0ABQ5CKR7_9ASTR